MDRVKLQTQLASEEGVRYVAYTDTTGNLTVGIGHNLSNPISHLAVTQIYNDDVDIVIAALNSVMPWWTGMDDVRQRVLADLCFNMGITTLLTFTSFLGLLKGGQFVLAANDLAQTLWAKQVGTRATKLCAMLTTGLDPGL